MEVRMGSMAEGEIVFEFEDSVGVQVFKVNKERKLEQIASITKNDIRGLARMFGKVK